MQCDICGKNEATVHLTEIVNNKMSKLHLCEECAKKKGAEMEEHFGLSDLLAGLADFGAKITPERETKIKCPNCGLTFQDFKKTGRLGCGGCYSALEESLVPLIKRIHSSDRHFGKAPLRVSKTAKLAPKVAAKRKKVDKLGDLKARLQRAIKLEEFEEAARLRDKIRELEKRR